MRFWAPFWTWTLVLSLTAFAGIALVVAVGGLRDIHSMLKTLKEQHDQEAGQDKETQQS
jgi:hypothetical protein